VTVRVLLFARYRETAGKDCIDLEIEPGSTTAAVWEEVGRLVPALSSERAPLVAVEQTYARTNQRIERTCEIAFFPPVSGG
jgi:molybdopterin converting factor subunit 1